LQQSNFVVATSSTTFDGSALLKKSGRRTTPAIESSAELLSRMRSQNAFISSSSPSRGDDAATTQDAAMDTDPQIADLLQDIRDFVACGASVDGQATTKEILDQFRTRIPSDLTAKFKALLKEVCTLQKIDDVGVWKLKSDFQ